MLALGTTLSTSAFAQEKASLGKDANTGSRPAADLTPIARGHILYRDRCEICHFSASEAKKIGPGLKGIYTRRKFADGRRVDDASIEKWIVEGGKDMPPFKAGLNPSQIRDLLAYLKTI